MIGIDSNILLRYLLADDADQSPGARQLIDETCDVDNPAYVNEVILAEV